MKLKIENLKKSDRGIEVTGWVPYVDIVSVHGPAQLYKATDEQRKRQRIRYEPMLEEANKEYDAAKREFERLHLGDADLKQTNEE